MKQYSLTIPGILPGLNEYIDAERGHKGKYKAASMKKQAQNVIGFMIKTQLRGVKFDRPVVIHYLWIEPSRRRDKDNIAFAKKFIQDSLDAKRSYYRDYDQAMKTAKARAEHERGFWQQARLVKARKERKP